MNKVTVFSSGFLIGALLVLPSCDLFKAPEEKKEASAAHAPEAAGTVAPSSAKTAPSTSGGEVLLTLYDEKVPKITTEDFQNYKKELLEAQPNYASIIEFMPGANKQIFDSLKNEILVEEDIKKNKIDQTQAYKDDLDKIMKYARRSLNVKYFQEKHPITVTDAEIKAYYDENKSSIPQLVASQGGIEAKMVLFTTKEAADEFLAKVKDPKTNFDGVAKESNLTVKDLGEVNSQTYDIDGVVRSHLIELKKFPTVDLVTVNDKSFAVVKALKKTEPTYVPFEQVKSGIENLLKQQKGTEVLTKEIEKLEKEYNATTNDEYFERERKAQEEKAQKVAEAMHNEQEQKSAPAPMRAA
jgi:precorrin isomerase